MFANNGLITPPCGSVSEEISGRPDKTATYSMLSQGGQRRDCKTIVTPVEVDFPLSLRLRSRVKFFVNLLQAFPGYVSVDLGGGDICMS
jgi:hypothetical protein